MKALIQKNRLFKINLKHSTIIADGEQATSTVIATLGGQALDAVGDQEMANLFVASPDLLHACKLSYRFFLDAAKSDFKRFIGYANLCKRAIEKAEGDSNAS